MVTAAGFDFVVECVFLPQLKLVVSPLDAFELPLKALLEEHQGVLVHHDQLRSLPISFLRDHH